MNDNNICVRSPAHELLESARKKVRRTERGGWKKGNHMRVRSPAHELLKSARKSEVRAILGVWQQFWCQKLSELCFAILPFELAGFFHCTAKLNFSRRIFCIQNIIITAKGRVQKRFRPSSNIQCNGLWHCDNLYIKGNFPCNVIWGQFDACIRNLRAIWPQRGNDSCLPLFCVNRISPTFT